jgi:hypothetical protein
VIRKNFYLRRRERLASITIFHHQRKSDRKQGSWVHNPCRSSPLNLPEIVPNATLTDFTKMGFAIFPLIEQSNDGSVANVAIDSAIILIKEVDDNTNTDYTSQKR